MKINFSYLVLLLLLAFCTDHEDLLKRPFPSIQTNQVTNITNSGAIFHGTILQSNGNKIIDHGFVWGADASLSLERSEKKSIGELETASSFSSKISTTLTEGVTYYVRSYVETNKELIVYGNVVSFISLGSKAPVLTDFNPKTGRILDTVSIKGFGFSFIKNNNEVKFGNSKADIISFSDTLLQVRVPSDLSQIKSKISVSVIGNIAISLDDFALIGPQIFSTSSSVLKPCDTLTISGNNFAGNVEITKVFLNSTECSIIDLGSSQMKILVPVLLPTTESITLKVTSSNLIAVYNGSLTYKKPEFNGFVPRLNTTYNDTLTIRAKNLPLCGEMTVKIGSITPALIIRNDSTISFKIPESITQTQNNVSINFLNTPLNFSQTFNLSPITIQSISPTSGTFNDVITIVGKNFHPQKERNTIAIAGVSGTALSANPNKITAAVSVYASGTCGNCNNVYVWVDQLSSTSIGAFTLNSPIISSISPSTLDSQGLITITGNNFNPQASLNLINGITGFSGELLTATKQKIEFNADLNVLSGGNPYLTSTTTSQVSVNAGNQSSNEQTITFNYDGPWNTKKDFPVNPIAYPITFTFDNKFFIGLGASGNSFLKDLWAYDPILDEWKRMADFPGEGRINGFVFECNGIVYIGLGSNSNSQLLSDVWSYNPQTNIWSQLQNFPGSPRVNPESFGLNNFGYLAGGGDYPLTREFWKYDPNLDLWQKLATVLPENFQFQNNFLLNGKIYHFQPLSYTINGETRSYLYEYDESNESWIYKLKMGSTTAYSYFNKAIAGGYILFGGYINQGPATFLKYDPISNTLTSLTSLPSIRWGVLSGIIQSKLYIFGGFSNTAHPNYQTVYYNDLWEFEYSKYPN